jgi:spore coat protein H
MKMETHPVDILRRNRTAAYLLLLVLVVAGVSNSSGEEKSPASSKPAGEELFGLTRVHQFHLHLTPKEWEALQPGQGEGFSPFGGQPRQPTPEKKPQAGERETHRSGAMEFPWAHADLVANGKTFKNVGVRYKGHFTYMASSQFLKRSLKIDLQHFDEKGPEIDGIRRLTLNAGVLDPKKRREALAYAAFRGANVPASRTAFAEVTLSVPGKYDHVLVGLFTLIEDVDKDFLNAHFGGDNGLLMKPEGARGADYLGDEWAQYVAAYKPAREASKDEANRIMEFTKLVERGSEEEFRSRISSYLDTEEFLRYLGMSAMLVNLDSPFAMPQNFYMYLNPANKKITFIPWDLDLAFAAWPFGGSPEQQMDLSLMHPHVGQHKLIDRLLAIKEVKEQYQKILREMAAGCFSKEQLLKNIDAVELATKESLAREAKAVAARGEFGDGGASGIAGRAPDLRRFVQKRTESIQKQLAGKGNGYIPASPFGQ